MHRIIPLLTAGLLTLSAPGASGPIRAQEPSVDADPRPVRAEAVRGPRDAMVTIVEYSEFECDQCRSMSVTLMAILENYPDQIRLIYRQLPLNTVHPRSQKAAEASLCAFDQNGFWEYHDALFVSAKDLEVDSLKHWASVINLDRDRFDACLDGGEKAQAVGEDIRAAIDAGAYSTPTLFINGVMLTGNWPYRDVERMIEGELFRLLGEGLGPGNSGSEAKGPDDGDPGPLLYDRSLFQSP